MEDISNLGACDAKMSRTVRKAVPTATIEVRATGKKRRPSRELLLDKNHTYHTLNKRACLFIFNLILPSQQALSVTLPLLIQQIVYSLWRM